MVEEVKVVFIGIASLTLALPIGILLVAELLREQQRPSTQDNRQTLFINK